MPPARLQIRLLGDFHLTYDGRPVAGLNADRPQTLLAYLLLHRESPQSRQHLAFLLWPDSTEGQARSNLRNLLHTLRQGLPDADNFLLVESTTLQWRPDASYALDVAEFDQALLKARQVEDPAETQQWLEAAVAVYQGDLLPGNYDDWLIPYREARHQAFLDTLEQADVIIVAGEAESHCVLESVEDIVEDFGDQPEALAKIYFLSDCTSPVMHPDIDFHALAVGRFQEFAARGLHFVASSDDAPFRAPVRAAAL